MAIITRPFSKVTFPFSRRLICALSTRSFGSVSALQIHTDDDDEDYFYSEAEEQTHSKAPIAVSAGSVLEQAVRWVFLGDSAAKRHIFAEKLSSLIGVPHISMTTLLRRELNPRSTLYKRIAEAVNHGDKISEDVILGLLSSRLQDGYSRGETGFILDGIPRTKIQAEALEEMTDIDTVMNFKCTEKSIAKNDLEQIKSSGSADVEQRKVVEDYYRKQRKLLDFEVAAGAPQKSWLGLLLALRI